MNNKNVVHLNWITKLPFAIQTYFKIKSLSFIIICVGAIVVKQESSVNYFQIWLDVHFNYLLHLGILQKKIGKN